VEGTIRDGDIVHDRVRRFRVESPIDEIRRFVLDQVVSRSAGDAGADSVWVTIRVEGDQIEMIVRSGRRAGWDGRANGFPQWFVQMLRLHGLTQQAAARRLGVSGKTVNRWVRGHTEPRLRELRRVQAVFGEAPPL
jgi:DNA-binding XRE family transcriptional regulator